MADRTSVFAMVNQVLAESREKLASDPGIDKTASVAQPQPDTSADTHKVASKHTIGDLEKLADACDHLAKNIHLVNDDRTPQEKLAEYSAIHEALRKQAAEEGDVNPNKAHQTQKANPESQSPDTVNLDDSGTGVGSGNAVPSEETNTPGTSLEAGESGEATGAHQSPQSVSPTEKPNPQDAANALETNKEMLQPDQPDDVLKQAAKKMPAALAQNVAKVKSVQRADIPGAEVPADLKKKAMVLMEKARQDGVPPHIAKAMLKVAGIKIAEDALFPAQIAAGTEPDLQSEPGVPSQLSQGSEAGSNTPRQTAPTVGEGGGRDLVGSVESAMNATKGQAKSQNKGALAELLTEPMQTSATDKTLQKSLDNTSSAGVKISSAQANAARELLRKFASSSPENRQKVLALAKLAQDPEMAAAGGGMPPEGGEMAAPPDDEVPAVEPPVEEVPEEEGAVSDEALEAAKAGVTPEEVAQAEELLAEQGAEAAEAEEAMVAPSPEAGGKESQGMPMGGGAPMGGGMGAGGMGMGSSMPVT
jgi:hypothetical protein